MSEQDPYKKSVELVCQLLEIDLETQRFLEKQLRPMPKKRHTRQKKKTQKIKKLRQ